MIFRGWGYLPACSLGGHAPCDSNRHSIVFSVAGGSPPYDYTSLAFFFFRKKQIWAPHYHHRRILRGWGHLPAKKKKEGHFANIVVGFCVAGGIFRLVRSAGVPRATAVAPGFSYLFYANLCIIASLECRIASPLQARWASLRVRLARLGIRGVKLRARLATLWARWARMCVRCARLWARWIRMRALGGSL